MFSDLAPLAPALLHAYWSLATFAALVAALPMKGMRTFRHAVQLSAARGKLWEDRPGVNLGPLTHAAVPQSWFAHFYALGTVCNTACVGLFLTHLSREAAVRADQAAALAALAALQLHLLRRWYESVAVMLYPPQARMHAIAYLFGLSYYGMLGASLLPSRDLVAMLARGMQSASADLAKLQAAAAQSSRLAWSGIGSGGGSAAVLLGLAAFITGNALQNQSHRILAALAASAGDGAGQHETYQIPHGGGFEWVSCPHYLGEIIIYIGLLLLQRGRQLNAWLILLWVMCNLVLAAKATHAWYCRKFEEYPRHRRVLVPLLW